jgi:hypothetical protein
LQIHHEADKTGKDCSGLKDLIKHNTQDHNMLNLAFRLLAITVGLLGIVVCAFISAEAFERTAKDTATDIEHYASDENQKHLRGDDTSIDTQGSRSNLHAALFNITNIFTQHIIIMLDILDIGSNRAFRLQKKFARTHHVWAASAAQMHPVIV